MYAVKSCSFPILKLVVAVLHSLSFNSLAVVFVREVWLSITNTLMWNKEDIMRWKKVTFLWPLICFKEGHLSWSTLHMSKLGIFWSRLGWLLIVAAKSYSSGIRTSQMVFVQLEKIERQIQTDIHCRGNGFLLITV